MAKAEGFGGKDQISQIFEQAHEEGTFGRKRKLDTMAILFSEICPACGKVKDLLRWVCFSCWEKNKDTKEARATARACVAHMSAVKTYIAACKKK